MSTILNSDNSVYIKLDIMENEKQVKGNSRAAENNAQAVHGMRNVMASEKYEHERSYSKLYIDFLVKCAVSVIILLCFVYAAKDKIAALAVSIIADSMSGQSYSSSGSQTGQMLENMFRAKKTDIADTPENRASGKSIDASELFPAEKPQGSSIGFVTMPEMDESLAQEQNNTVAGPAAQEPENPIAVIKQMKSVMASPVYQSYMKEISEAIKQDTGTDISKNPMAAFGVLNNSPRAKAVAEKYRNNPEFIKVISQLSGISGFGKISSGSIPPSGMSASPASGSQMPKSFSLQVVSGSSSSQNSSDTDADSQSSQQSGNSILSGYPQGSPSKVVSVPKSEFSTRGASAANSSAGMPFDD